MILVKALDSFLYNHIQVMTGNKVNVDENDIPKLVNAGKISQSYMEFFKPKMCGIKLDTLIQDAPPKFLKQPGKTKSRKSKKLY